MDTDLRDKTVLVTGAAGGIGSEVARAFVTEGARVAMHYHTHGDRLPGLFGKENGTWRGFAADLTSETEVHQLFQDVEAAWGPIHVLVANAGRWPTEDVPIHAMSLERWQATLNVNLTSVFLCVRSFLQGVVRHQLANPAMILIGSTAATFGEAGHADYAAAKAGLTYGLLQSLKNETCRIAPRGRVNVVCPGWTVTPMVDRFTGNEAKVRRVLQTIALRKVAKPVDVANAVVYLASDKLAGHVTGQVLTVSGGMEGRVLYAPDEVDPMKAI